MPLATSMEWGGEYQAAFSKQVVALLTILLVTMGLAIRAGMPGRLLSPTDSEIHHHSDLQESGLVETCARAFVLVLLSLFGLLALGMMYGNVLGSANASP